MLRMTTSISTPFAHPGASLYRLDGKRQKYVPQSAPGPNLCMQVYLFRRRLVDCSLAVDPWYEEGIAGLPSTPNRINGTHD